MLLQGKTAVISGAASPRGIGFATARLFAAHGARIAILDLDEHGAKEAAASLGPDHLGIRCNVTDLEECKRAAEAAITAFGQVDILLNNAGITQPVKTMEIDEASWRRIVDVNLTGVALSQPSLHSAHALPPSGLDRLHVVGVGPTRRRDLWWPALLGREGWAFWALPKPWRGNSGQITSGSIASRPA